MKQKQNELGITSRSDNYGEWYNDLVVRADLAEDSAVRGCMVIKPHGYAIWELMQQALDKMFKATGHKNAYFPLFLPKSFLEREAEHVEGFAKECAVVTHHRLKQGPTGRGLIVDPEAKLEEELVIRPTSETIIWSTYKGWVQSYRDLPLLINQWANVVRWEMRTRKFLRTAEFLWQEGHTAHATYDEAEREALTMLEVYRSFAEDWMAVPVIVGKKSEAEKFAGADHTYCIEAMTQDLRSIQAGTSHHLGQNFARAFDVKFVTRENALSYVYGTSWGVSTRLVGTLIMVHSDDNGLVLPPRLAPIQVVIIPIGREDSARSAVIREADQLAVALQAHNWGGVPIRVAVDSREKESPGFKYNYWEMRGACLRIELGLREIEGRTCVLVRRDTGEKETIALTESAVQENVEKLLQGMQHDLLGRARALRDAHVVRVDDWAGFKQAFSGSGGCGFVLAHWDGTAETEARIAEETKATVRVIPFEPLDPSDGVAGRCVFSGRASDQRVVFARAY